MDKSPFGGGGGGVRERNGLVLNVLFGPSYGESLLLFAGRAAKCKQERKAMTPVSFKVSSNQKYLPRLYMFVWIWGGVINV